VGSSAENEPDNHSLGCQVIRSLDSLSHSKEFTSTPTKSKLFSVCSLQKPSKSLKVYKIGCLYSKIHRKFIGSLSTFYKVNEKSVSFIWDDACQKALKDIEEYPTKSPVLVAQILGKSFLLYVRVMDHSLGTLLAQKNDEGFKQVIYYLSQTLIRVECHYNPIEEECLAFVFMIQKTRHYLVGQIIHVIFRVNSLQIPHDKA